MSVAEQLLLKLSRPPAGVDYHLSDDDVSVDNALAVLERKFERALGEFVRGRAVLDYGCGDGKLVVALARAGAARVVGVDILEANAVRARALAERHGVGDRVEVTLGDVNEVRLPADAFDTAISSDAFEHFADPAGVLRRCRQALRAGGRLLVTFSPPWLHPYGSHMQFFTRVPWVHVLFSESTVMRVRARYRADGARRYSEVEGGLNRMTVSRFRELVTASGFEMETLTLRAIKGIDVLTGVPGLRELVTNKVACILRQPEARR